MRLPLGGSGAAAHRARLQPALRHRDPPAAGEHLGPALARALVRDGPARGGRPLARAARRPPLRRALGADAARPASRPSAARWGARSSCPARGSTRRWSPSGAAGPAPGRRRAAPGAGGLRRPPQDARRTPSPSPAPTAPRWPRPSRRSGHPPTVRPEALAPADFPPLAEALGWTG